MVHPASRSTASDGERRPVLGLRGHIGGMGRRPSTRGSTTPGVARLAPVTERKPGGWSRRGGSILDHRQHLLTALLRYKTLAALTQGSRQTDGRVGEGRIPSDLVGTLAVASPASTTAPAPATCGAEIGRVGHSAMTLPDDRQRHPHHLHELCRRQF